MAVVALRPTAKSSDCMANTPHIVPEILSTAW